MTVSLGQSVVFAIGHEDSDGAPSNAASIAGTLYRNGASTAETVTLTNLATGIYSVAFTVPAGWAIADVLQVRIVADGIGRFVWGDVVDVTVNSRNATTPPTAGAIADAVWDEARSGHTTAGTFGFYLDAAISGVSGGGGGGDAEQATLLDVQTTVNTIYSQTSQITGSRISTVGPVSAAGDITLIVGKDYKVASESELTISVPDTAGALHADFTSGTLAASKAFGMSRANGDADIAGTIYSVTYATNVTTFKVQIDADQLPDTLSLTDDWTYQIERVTSAGDKVVGVQGAGKVAMRAV